MRKDRKILILNTREFPSRLKKENDWKEQFNTEEHYRFCDENKNACKACVNEQKSIGTIS